MSIQNLPGAVTLKATGAVARRQAMSRSASWVLLLISMIGIGMLVLLLIDVLRDGLPNLDWQFITSHPSVRSADVAGIRAALIGWLWVIGLTMLFTIPIGVGAAIWIEEFAPKNKFTTMVELNISNLAGVPSIIYGILGLTVFSRFFGLGPSILTGALTLTLMIMPMTIIAAQQAVRQVPDSLRQGSLALGATRWQTVWFHVLPQAIPGIMTGTILAISRAAGEAAALVMIGAFALVRFDNASWNDDFTTLPIQIFTWTQVPNEDFRALASTAIIVLLVIVLSLNVIAAIIRERYRRA